MLVLEIGRKATIYDVAFAPDGRALVAVCDSGAYWWTGLVDQSRAESPAGAMQFDNARFTSDGRWLFTGVGERFRTRGQMDFPTGTETRDLYRIDPWTGARAVLHLWGGYCTRFDVSPTAPLVLVVQEGRYHAPSLRVNEILTARVALWQAEDLSPTGKVWERDLARRNYYCPLQFLAGGARFALLDFDSDPPHVPAQFRVVIHDTATGAPIAVRPVTMQTPHEWLLGPDGNLFVARGNTHIDLHRLDAPDAGPVRIRNDNRRHFTAVAFHPTGRFLAAASNDQSVKLYDTATGDLVRTFTWQLGRVQSVRFSPDGALAAAGSDKGQVVVWDIDL